MRQLSAVYTQYVNRTPARVGNVFQGRYAAILVEGDSYLLEVERHVVLNPVHVGMVAHAGEWPWSSYAVMVGEAQCPSWLERYWLPGLFAKRRPTAVRRAKPPPALETFLETGGPRKGMAAAYRTGAYTMQAVADAFGVH